MLNLLRKIKRAYFPKGLQRQIRKVWFGRVRPYTPKHLARAIKPLDIHPEAIICMHTMLSAFGHLKQGPESIIHTLRECLPDATLMMPTFPLTQMSKDHLAANKIYNPRHIPVLPEQMQGSLRRIGKATKASAQEIAFNPRARSAVLRIAEKLS